MFKYSEQNEKFPVLPPGLYGVEEEATLIECRCENDDGEVETVPWDSSQAACRITVLVKSAEHGFIRVGDFLNVPKDDNEQLGNKAAKWFRQLGVPDESIRSGFNERDLEGMAVKVQVTQRTDKNGIARNNIGNLLGA